PTSSPADSASFPNTMPGRRSRNKAPQAASEGKLLRHPSGKKGAAHGSKPSMGAFGDLSFEDMAQITLDAIGDAVLVVNPEGRVIYLNKVAETLTGWSGDEALGRLGEDVFFILDGVTRKRAVSPAQRAMSEGRIVELALGSVLIRSDGT